MSRQTCTRWLAWLGCLSLCLFFTPSLATAAPALPGVSIDDLTDTLTITPSALDSFTSAISRTPAGLEQVTFSGFFASTSQTSETAITSIVLTAPSGGIEPAGSVSDTLQMTIAPSTEVANDNTRVSGTFLSDLTSLPPDIPDAQAHVAETGAFQNFPALGSGGQEIGFTASVRSDISSPEPVPEPTALVSVGSALLALLGYTWWRHRRP
jgi:hypothetical protein